jgi:hypothetical protein
MLSGPTVLVLGAGSSVDFSMPVGSELAADIAQRLDLRARYPGDGYRSFVQAGQKLASVLPAFSSIDDCLYTHGEDDKVRLMGKMAIARIIAERENQSWLGNLWGSNAEREIALGRMWGGWAQRLVRILATGLRAAERDQLFQSLTLVTFNYDRCAETAFFHAVRRTFDVASDEAARIMSRLQVVRPYGGLGQLPWAGREGEQFGNPAPDLFALANQIRVYTDEEGERPDLEALQGKLQTAKNVVLLGFGFHPLNMRLLTIGREDGSTPNVFATAVNEPSPRRTEITRRVREAFSIAPTLAYSEIDCTRLIAQYGGQFSA